MLRPAVLVATQVRPNALLFSFNGWQRLIAIPESKEFSKSWHHFDGVKTWMPKLTFLTDSEFDINWTHVGPGNAICSKHASGAAFLWIWRGLRWHRCKSLTLCPPFACSFWYGWYFLVGVPSETNTRFEWSLQNWEGLCLQILPILSVTTLC